MSLVVIGLPQLYIGRLFKTFDNRILRFQGTINHHNSVRNIGKLVNTKFILGEKDYHIKIGEQKEDIIVGELTIDTRNNDVFFVQHSYWKMIVDTRNIISIYYETVNGKNYIGKYFYNRNRELIRLISVNIEEYTIIYRKVSCDYEYNNNNNIETYIINDTSYAIEKQAKIMRHISTNEIVIIEDEYMWVKI